MRKMFGVCTRHPHTRDEKKNICECVPGTRTHGMRKNVWSVYPAPSTHGVRRKIFVNVYPAPAHTG
nr:MAG: hypothetical protein [Molluscum contagiosum virus]